MKKIAVAILSVALIASSMSVQAKSSTGKTLAWLAAGAVAGYAIKSAMGDNNSNNQNSQYQNSRDVTYQDSDGCIVKVSKQRLDNGDIQEVHVKQCRNSQNYNY